MGWGLTECLFLIIRFLPSLLLTSTWSWGCSLLILSLNYPKVSHLSNVSLAFEYSFSFSSWFWPTTSMLFYLRNLMTFLGCKIGSASVSGMACSSTIRAGIGSTSFWMPSLSSSLVYSSIFPYSSLSLTCLRLSLTCSRLSSTSSITILPSAIAKLVLAVSSTTGLSTGASSYSRAYIRTLSCKRRKRFRSLEPSTLWRGTTTFSFSLMPASVIRPLTEKAIFLFASAANSLAKTWHKVSLLSFKLDRFCRFFFIWIACYSSTFGAISSFGSTGVCLGLWD